MAVNSALSSSGASSGSSNAVSAATGANSVGTSASANAPVTLTGLASGLNTSSIIEKLTQAEQNQVTEVQNQQSALQSKLTVYQTLGNDLSSLGNAAQTLASYGAFSLVTGSSSNSNVATITADTGATAGSYNLSVTQLAQAEKLSSSAQSSTTGALGLSGTIVVNGQAVSVASSDSLTSIAQAINTLNNGVNASVINGGTGNAYLTLTSSNTGAANAIELADLNGNVLSSLGITSGSPALASPTETTAQSYTFSSSTESLNNLMGIPSGSYSFSINGGSTITVNPSTDTLQSIANAINASGSGVTASVTASPNGNTGYQLTIASNTDTTPTFTDTNNLLASLGVLQAAPANSLVSAQDAKFSLDNANLTSASNTITTAIPGATITLLQGGTTVNDVTTPATSTLNLTQNTSTIVSNVSAFVSAYNAVNDYINQESGFDSSSYATGPLFGDPIAQQVESSLSNMILSNVQGTSGNYTNLASLGFTFDSSGDLQVDTTTLTAAIQSDPSAVSALFQTTGSTNSANLSFVGSTTNSVPSGTGSYSVNITQPATEEVYTAGTAQTSANPSTEDLTFSGAAIGNTPYVLELPANATLASTIQQINSDPTLSKVMVASDQGGYLQLQSQIYGTAGNFTVVSSSPAASDTSGVGTSGGTYVNGQDVAGTINGETASGAGQYLTGNSGNATTDGLEVQYTGSGTGLVGSVTFNSGVAVQLESFINSYATSANGALQSAEAGINTQITDLSTQITADNTDLQNQTTQLQNEFASMEEAIETAKQQSSQISSLTGQQTTASGIQI